MAGNFDRRKDKLGLDRKRTYSGSRWKHLARTLLWKEARSVKIQSKVPKRKPRLERLNGSGEDWDSYALFQECCKFDLNLK